MILGEVLKATRKFTVKGQERAFILKMSAGVPLNGQIVVAPNDVLDLHSVKVAFDSEDPDLAPLAAVPVDPGGTFQVDRMMPGDYAVRILRLPGNAYLESASSGNSDILSQPLHVDYAAPATMRFTLGLDGGHLDGIVYDRDHHDIPGATIVLAPDAARRANVSYFQVTESGPDGEFDIRGIPPGDYTLFAWQGIEPNAFLDATFLQPYEALGTKLTIAANSDNKVVPPLIPMD
jgi:hypothetical protein